MYARGFHYIRDVFPCIIIDLVLNAATIDFSQRNQGGYGRMHVLQHFKINSPPDLPVASMGSIVK